MAHKRKEIRAAIVTLLSGATDADTRVYSNRTRPINNSQLPAINVVTLNEEAEPRDIRPTSYIRTMKLNIELYVEANDTPDDELDDFAEDVEAIMLANLKITGLAISTVYQATEATFDDAGGEKPIGKLVLTYEIKYIY